MAKNIWTLDVDLKFKYSSSVPTFRRKDTAVINFRIYDNKELYDISTFTSGEVTITFPLGRVLVKPCQRVMIDGVNYIQYIVDSYELNEIGTYKFNLSFQSGDGRVSVQDILINFFDSIGTSELAYVKLIQDLQNQMVYLDSLIDNIVLKSAKGNPNGVVELDKDGKIKEVHMPNYLKDHVNTNFYMNWVHGLYIDENGIAKYETKNGGEENVGHPDISTDLRLKVQVIEGVAYLTFRGEGYTVITKFMYGDNTLDDVKANGVVLISDSFVVNDTGIWSIYYKDDKGKEYLYKFPVAVTDLKTPNVDISISEGEITVTDDSDYTIEIQKWDAGTRVIPYFQTNGNVFTDTFVVNTAGTYTVYVKYTNGLEIVKVFEVKESDLVVNPPIISIVLTPNNQTWSNTDKTANIAITEKSTILDRRYYYSTTDNVTIVDFRNDTSLGTTMISNTQSAPISENGYFYVYAKNKGNLDTLQQISITSIDKIAPTATSSQTQTNGVVTITVNATDNASGVDRIVKPDGSTVTGTTTTYSVTDNGDYNFTVYDRAGNSFVLKVAVSSIVKTPPVITLTPSPTAWTNQSVTVSVSATSQNGIALIKWASGNQPVSYFNTGGVTITTGSFSVSSNGVYTVYAKDNIGVDAVKTITISNIDKTAPVLNITRTTAPTQVTFNVSATDSESGVNRIVKPDGSITYGSSTTYIAGANGNYTFEVYDNVGNKSTKTETVSGMVVNEYKKIYIDRNTVYAMTTKGDLYANGNGEWYRRGDGLKTTTVDDNTPTKASISNVVKVASDTSGANTWFLTANGDLYYVGSNYETTTGGLEFYSGVSGTANITIPTKSAKMSGVKDFVISDHFTMFAQNFAGEWYGWGLNDLGELGLGHKNKVTTPTKINFVSNLKQIAVANSGNFLYLTNDGLVYGMGYNTYGSLGLGHTNEVTTPTRLTSLSNIASITMGRNASFFVHTNGQVYSTGRGDIAQGSTLQVNSPTLISGLSNIKKVSGTIALATNGNVYGWGNSDLLGLGVDYSSIKTPTILPLSNVRDVVMDETGYSTIFITTANDMYGTGSNGRYNQFADSSIGDTTSMMKLNNWTAIQ